MKAKEYVTEFRNHIKAGQDKQEATGRIVMGLMREVIEIGEARHCQTDDSFLSVWDEIENKWHRICEMLPEERFRQDGMWLFLQNAYPELWNALQAARVARRIRRQNKHIIKFDFKHKI